MGKYNPDDYSERAVVRNKIIDLYKQGASSTEVIALLTDLDVLRSRDTFYRWLRDEKYYEFQQVIKEGLVYSQAWWERTGRSNLMNKDLNSPVYCFNMKNRFKEEYGEKQTVVIENNFDDLTDEQIAERIAKLQTKQPKKPTSFVRRAGEEGEGE